MEKVAFWLVRNSVTLIQIVFFAFMGMFHVWQHGYYSNDRASALRLRPLRRRLLLLLLRGTSTAMKARLLVAAWKKTK